MDRNESRPRHSSVLRRQRILISLIWIVIGLLSVTSVVTAVLYSNARAESRALQAEQQRLEEGSAALMEEIDFAKTDEYITRTARSELGMIFDGEISFVNSH